MSDNHPNEVPEFAHTDRATRRRELAAAGARPHEHLDKIKKNLKLPTLVKVESEAQPLAALPNPCPERVIVRLLTGPNQGLLKQVTEQWSDGYSCYSDTYTFGIQFTGYGAYGMSFEKDPTGSNLFGNFFRDVSGYGVNFHRTMVFVKETWENPNAANVQRVLLDGSATNAAVDTHYLANLSRLVSAAKSWGVVVQVCLFVHHGVVGPSVPNNTADMPKPVVLAGSAHDRYKAFCNTSSTYLQTQKNFIDAVARQLLPHWNVVYEVGNEMRVPNPVLNVYDDRHLKAWIDWVANQIRVTDKSHLVTTSTGIENEPLVNGSSLIQFCSFHQGQWVGKMDTACNNAKSYGNKHVVFDDDGSTRPLSSVKAWSKAALNTLGGCKVSFNHKGYAPINAYNSQWINQAPPSGQESIGTPADALVALRDARATSTSPCARNN